MPVQFRGIRVDNFLQPIPDDVSLRPGYFLTIPITVLVIVKQAAGLVWFHRLNNGIDQEKNIDEK